jgi:hypothetical protein
VKCGTGGRGRGGFVTKVRERKRKHHILYSPAQLSQ